MDTTTNFPPQVDGALSATTAALASVASGAASRLQAFADSQKRTADRLGKIELELAKQLGDSDPEVLKVRQQKQQSLLFATSLQTALTRAQILPKPKTGEQGFAGSVTTAEGARAHGVAVQLVQTAAKVDKKIATARTNQFGDFALNIPLCDLDPKAKWKVVVQNEAGETLASEPANVNLAEGVIAFVPLVLRPPATTPSAARERSAPPPAPQLFFYNG